MKNTYRASFKLNIQNSGELSFTFSLIEPLAVLALNLSSTKKMRNLSMTSEFKSDLGQWKFHFQNSVQVFRRFFKIHTVTVLLSFSESY